MAISNTNIKGSAAGNGATTVFPIVDQNGTPIVFFSPSDLFVGLWDTANLDFVAPAPVLNGGGTYDYTITVTNTDPTTNELTGSIAFNNAPLGTYVARWERNAPATSSLTWTDNGKNPSAGVNAAADRAMALAQQILARAILLPIGDPQGLNAVIPDAATRANTVLAFDADGNVYAAGGDTGSIPVSVAMVPVVEAVTLALALALLGGAPVGSTRQILGKITAARLDSVADQNFTAIGTLPAKFRITAVYATNANGSLAASAALGGAWTGAGKTGTNVVPITEPYTSLTSSAALYEFGLSAGMLERVFAALPLWALSTVGAAGETADIYVEGIPLP